MEVGQPDEEDIGSLRAELKEGQRRLIHLRQIYNVQGLEFKKLTQLLVNKNIEIVHISFK